MEKKGVTESLPFNDRALVFKVMGKMFALTDIEEFGRVTLKCNPEKALELRAKYMAVKPGYHMNKKHWNTVELDESISPGKIYEWTDQSYDLVVSKLSRKQKKDLQKL